MKSANEKSMAKFVIIWVGQLISSIGSGITAFALGVYAFEKTQSATVFSLIIFFAFLPSYLLKPLGGTLSDRYNRRVLIILGDLGSALSIAFILLMIIAGYHQMWVVYLGVALSSVFVALQNPAYKATVSDLVSESSFAKASGLMQMSESARFIVSPIIAGFLMHCIAIEMILLLDMATFLLAIFVVFAINKKLKQKAPIKGTERFFDDFKSGFRYTFSNRGLLYLLLLTSLITFSIGFLQALMGPMILAFTNAKLLGIIQTIIATGMLTSSLFIGIFSKGKRQVSILCTALLFTGLFYALFGALPQVAFIIVTGFLFFATLPFVNTSLEVLIRKNVPNNLQGRVWSIVSLISQLGMILAFAMAGFLADKMFTPLLLENGLLAESVGKIIGTGPGRGIGLMFILAGILTSFVAALLFKNKTIQTLES